MPSSFRPFALLRGGHLQTLGGVALRSRLRWSYPTEDVVVPAGEDGVELLLRASWQSAAGRPAMLLLHGLEGCDRSSYVLSTGAVAYEEGWHVVRMNLRGCGDSLALCPRLYNAGLTSDLVSVLRWLSGRARRIAAVGFSLGANLLLLTLGRERESLPEELLAAVAVSPPLTMSACADALETPPNRFYQARFLSSLLRSYRERQKRLPQLYAAGFDRALTTLREFDDAITARYGGYADVEDYYREVSSGPRLAHVDRPTLVLASLDDPLIPGSSVTRWTASDRVTMEVSESGGHVGFAGPTTAPGYFWAAERTIRFLRESLDGEESGDSLRARERP